MEGKLTVGQKLWYVPSGRKYNQSMEVTVATIGRKWFTVEPSYVAKRFSIASLCADYESSIGQCWISKEEYESKVALDYAWSQFVKAVNDRNYEGVPAGITVEDIASAAELLKLEIK